MLPDKIERPEGFPDNPTIQQSRALANQELFLDALTRSGSKGDACKVAGISLSAVDQWVNKDLYGFKKREEMALQSFLGVIEREINRRALEGIPRKLHYRGQVFDSEVQYSDNLLMFRAKRLDPAYKDNYQTPVSAPNTLTQVNIHLHPDAVAKSSIVEVLAIQSVVDDNGDNPRSE